MAREMGFDVRLTRRGGDYVVDLEIAS